MKRAISILSVMLLLLPLVLPQGLALLGVSEGPGTVEKQLKTPRPELSLAVQDFKAFAGQTARAYIDAFPFRDTMIRTANGIKMALFRESPSSSVVMGADGWLFFPKEMAIEDWMGLGHYTPEELARMVALMRERRDWLAARDVAILVVIAPNKATVYGEFMPASLHKLSPVTRLDQLSEAMRQSGIPYLDLRDALAKAKTVRRAYWKTDTHWNGWGAFAGSAAIVEALRQRFPAMPPLLEEEYQVSEYDAPGGDLAEMLLLEATLRERMVDMVPLAPTRARPAQGKGYKDPAIIKSRAMIIRETGDATLPTAVFFRDSFSTAAVTFLAERFQRSVFLWDHRFLRHIVEAEKPDVVIFEAVERYQHALFVAP
ncbi:MAG: alginate O-acetyltransferase AlgX-related protein [Acidobacteriota bacterium]